MLALLLFQHLVQSCLAFFRSDQEPLYISARPDYKRFTFSQEWHVLGPFQIGTREATWGADPLEFYGGFHKLEYNANATYKSPLTTNGTVTWSHHYAGLAFQGGQKAYADLNVAFPKVEWQSLRDTYGWAALQWQGWARGEITILPLSTEVFVLHTEGVLEYWIDDKHYFGGDFYGYRKVPVVLRLKPGNHRIDVRLVRDVRSMGGVGEPSVDIKLELQRSSGGLHLSPPGLDQGVLISDAIGGIWGPMASSYAAVTIRNHNEHDVYVYGMAASGEMCRVQMLSNESIRLRPGQTRPIAFRLRCNHSYDRRIDMEMKFRVDGSDWEYTLPFSAWPKARKTMYEPHKMTYLGPGGIVSYAILRPPSPNATCGPNQSLPVMLAMHGAGLEADSDTVKHALDDLPDLCAWVLFPTGVTPWSGDDWHIWGMADVEAAIAAIPSWIEHVGWEGPGVDIDRWLVTGHSNGGQGALYVLTHRPDKVIAAAALSAYSSIQNYVPYTLWHTADPGQTAMVQSALLSYRHELLLENAKDIPVFQQHGSADDNVPVYNSRLLAQRIEEAGAGSIYYEVPGRAHYWDGVMTTQPLAEFFDRQLSIASTSGSPLPLQDFSIVVARVSDMGTKNGVWIIDVRDPGRLARIHFTFDPTTLTCMFELWNVVAFRIGPYMYDDCQYIHLNGQSVDVVVDAGGVRSFRWRDGTWNAVIGDVDGNEMDGKTSHRSHQTGGLDVILGSKGTFTIVTHSSESEDVALQISRNLCQYYAADTEITEDYEKALASQGNVISIGIGAEIPDQEDHPFTMSQGKLGIMFNGLLYEWSNNLDLGLAAVFLRPLPHRRLELVVWGADEASLSIAARLIPMLSGGGQPDFIVADRTMLWKGLEGTLALGFFNSYWQVSSNSFVLW